MKIKSLEIQGFRGIAHDAKLTITEQGHRNILIGPNNSGKSIPFRFLHFIAEHLQRTTDNNSTKLYHTINSNIDDSFWWKHDSSNSITSLVDIAMSDGDEISGFKTEFFDDNKIWRMQIGLYRQDDNTYLLLIAPMIWKDNQWKPILEYTSGGENPKNLNNDGQFISSNTTGDCPYLKSGFDLLRTWSQQLHFFDPVRSTDRGSGLRGMDDGSTLLVSLHDLQQEPSRLKEHQDFMNELKRQINTLLTPSGVSPITNIQVRGGRETPLLTITQQDSTPVALEDMGTGIAELVILLSSIIKNALHPAIYFIEEPETHLHPGLFRRLMSMLENNTNIQFFVTSHSSVVLDTLTEVDRVYHFYQRNDGACLCDLAKEITQQQRLLDSLGVSASALLQTNCVIWIEGPSDRLYLRHWIKQVDSELKEGSDYAFVFYGGKILSHFSLEANDAIYDDLIKMTNIGRFSAVIMDRDLPPDEDKIRETKQRICDEAEKDSEHRRAYITSNREIENDVPKQVLVNAFSIIIDDTGIDLSKLDFPQQQTYTKEVISHLNLDDEVKAKTIQGKIANKVNLARTIIELLETQDYAVPEYINDLCEFIRSSQNLEA